MKKFLVTIALLGFGYSASADHYEVQINGGFGGTSGSITMNDDDRGDNTPWSIGAEVYKQMNDKFQLGGLLSIANNDVEASLGVAADDETTFSVGVLGRYNFGDDMRNGMFAGGGLSFNDVGNGDFIGLHLNFGKRYALSDTITYTPNVSYITAVSGELDSGPDIEGSSIIINFISFSGFM